MSTNYTNLKNIIDKPLSGEWGDGEGEINVLRTTNFTNDGKLDLNEVVKRNINIKKIKQKQLQYGDSIIEKSGGSPSQPVGRVVFFDQPEGIYLCNNFTSVIRGKSDVDKRYLFWFLFNNHLTKNTLKYQNKTTGIINLQLERYIEELQIPLPPLPIQKRIAEILDAAAALKRKDQELLKKYDELAQAIFIDMFGDPVKNEKGWEVGKLNNEIKSIRYGTGSPPIYSDEGIPFIRATNIKKGTVVEKGMVYLSQDEAKKIEKCYINEGDLIIVRSGANTGDCAYIPEKYSRCLAGYDLIVEMDKVKSRFYNYLINSIWGKAIVDKLSRRAGQPHLNAEQVCNMEFITPNYQLLMDFKIAVDTIDLLKENSIATNVKSELFFNSLLSKAFNGELAA